MNRNLSETQADSASVESAVFTGREAGGRVAEVAAGDARVRADAAGVAAGAADAGVDESDELVDDDCDRCGGRPPAGSAAFGRGKGAVVVDDPETACVAAAAGAVCASSAADGEPDGVEASGVAVEADVAEAATEPDGTIDLPGAADSSEDVQEEPASPDLLHFDMASVAAYGRKPAEATRPEPRIVVLPDFCLNPRGGSCSRCVRACPVHAVSLEGEGGLPVVDEKACTMCGICLGICDAFSSNSVTMTDLASRIRRTAQRGEGVFVTCPVNVEAAGEGFEPAPCVVEVPCLAALSPEFWTLVLAEGADLKLACDLSLCPECERAGSVAELLYAHAIETAQAWTGKTVDIVDEIPAKTGYLRSFATGEELDRRGAFAHFAGNVADAASGDYRRRNSDVLQDFYERRERMRAMTRQMDVSSFELSGFDATGRTRRMLQPKRKMLLDALEKEPSIASRVSVVVSGTDCALCCNALDCARVCPTGARSPHARSGLLAFDVRFCIGCGLCAQVCRTGAAFLEEGTAEVFRVASEGAAVVCPEKLVEFEAARAAEAEAGAAAARLRAGRISEAT